MFHISTSALLLKKYYWHGVIDYTSKWKWAHHKWYWTNNTGLVGPVIHMTINHQAIVLW